MKRNKLIKKTVMDTKTTKAKRSINPQVYVGTWAKYNAGSIAGAWIALRDYSNYNEFLKACYDLHSDERDPELMIQDTEDMPDGMDTGDYISAREYADIIAACEEADKAARASKSGDKALLPDYMEEMAKVWQGSMLEHCKKNFSYAIRLDGGELVAFDKPGIENRFCWADEGPELEDYERVTGSEESLKRYFIAANLQAFDKKIELLQSLEPDSSRINCIKRCDGFGKDVQVWRWGAYNRWDIKERPQIYGDIKPLSESDRVAILEAEKHERRKFEKRLKSYLKRYGVSKLHTWTYWRDA